MSGFGQSRQCNQTKANTNQLHKLVEEAVRLHKKGQLDKAETLYLQALNSGLEHEIILSNLGVIYKRTNRIDQAIAIYERAIALKPEFADSHANLGGLLQERRDYDQAQQSLRQAIRLDPNHAIAYSNLGLALQAKGETQEALNNALKAIRIKPDEASTHTNLGIILKAQGQLEQAASVTEQAIRLDSTYIPAYISLATIFKEIGNLDTALSVVVEAQKLNPHYAPTLISMGSILQERGQIEEAIQATRQAIELDPSNAVAYVNLGIMLQSNDQLSEALIATKQAIGYDPHNAMAHRSLGAICRDMGQMRAALNATSKSIELNPSDAVAYMNLGCIYAELCEHQRAEDYYAKALEMDPDYTGALVNLSQVQLLRHDYKQGWENYKNRKDKVVVNIEQRRPRNCDISQLDSTQSVLVAGEQGIGDQILFASLLHEMQPRCKQIFVTVDERLLPLFGRSFSGNIQFLPQNTNLPSLPIDSFVSMGDLGALFRQSKTDFALQPAQYLTPEAERARAITEELKDECNNRVIGLSWHSTGKRYFNRKKCIAMGELAPALSQLAANFITLQYGDCMEDVASARKHHNLTIREVPDLDVTKDIDGLAALISACDDVVTISNVTAHLAGALGKPTHLLAPASPHFYWGLDASTTVWYPTVKIYRQTKDGDWKPALDQLATALHP